MVTTGERERESSPAPEVAEEQEIEGSSPAVARWWPERDDDDRDLRSRSMSICFRREWPLWRNSSSLAFLAKNSLAAVAVVVSISGVTSVSMISIIGAKEGRELVQQEPAGRQIITRWRRN
uniref:Uncharacterized protein n=1 Tax=Oryza barthii TaxID=65489 RepID=A0A0D3EIS8_9ORYZ